jgi:hypothetical protein
MIHWRAVQAYHAAFGRIAQPGDHLDECIIHTPARAGVGQALA